jgi:hypothetical protein
MLDDENKKRFMIILWNQKSDKIEGALKEFEGIMTLMNCA